jgi:hypothetical protein
MMRLTRFPILRTTKYLIHHRQHLSGVRSIQLRKMMLSFESTVNTGDVERWLLGGRFWWGAPVCLLCVIEWQYSFTKWLYSVTKWLLSVTKCSYSACKVVAQCVQVVIYCRKVVT